MQERPNNQDRFAKKIRETGSLSYAVLRIFLVFVSSVVVFSLDAAFSIKEQYGNAEHFPLWVSQTQG